MHVCAHERLQGLDKLVANFLKFRGTPKLLVASSISRDGLLVALAREMLSSVWTKWAAGEILIHCQEKEGARQEGGGKREICAIQTKQKC